MGGQNQEISKCFCDFLEENSSKKCYYGKRLWKEESETMLMKAELNKVRTKEKMKVDRVKLDNAGCGGESH